MAPLRLKLAVPAIIALGWLFAPTPAVFAQTPHFATVLSAAPASVETVIVTAPSWLGDHPRTVISNFVKAYAMAAPVSDEISRWRNGVCPATHGLSQEDYNLLVTARIREVADAAGAPVQTSACHVNIEVIFTDKPQMFLDRIRAEGGAALLGTRPSRAETEGTMRYAIQAWYATATRDADGRLAGDDQDDTGIWGSTWRDVPRTTVSGSLLRKDLRSELSHIYIVADTSKTQNYLLGAVADYVAVLALSQTQSFEDCKTIPSITNLISPNCAADVKPTAITDTDLALLKAIYSMDAGANLQGQQSYISLQIAQSLGVK